MLAPNPPGRASLAHLHTVVRLDQLQWLREQAGGRVRQAEVVRAALDFYREQVENK